MGEHVGDGAKCIGVRGVVVGDGPASRGSGPESALESSGMALGALMMAVSWYVEGFTVGMWSAAQLVCGVLHGRYVRELWMGA